MLPNIFPWIWSAANVDPATPWALLPSFGISGVTLVMAYFFLEYLKSEAKRRDEQDSKRDDRYEAFVEDQRSKYSETAARHVEVIRDNATAMREVRQGLDRVCRYTGGTRDERRTNRPPG